MEQDLAKTAAPGAPTMLVNSSKLRGVFSAQKCKALMPPALERAGRARTRGAALRKLEGVDELQYLFSPEMDSVVRDNCLSAGAVLS